MRPQTIFTRIVAASTYPVIFMGLACLFGVLGKELLDQRSENQNLRLQMKILAQKSAQIVRTQEKVTSTLEQVAIQSTEVVKGTLAEARVVDLVDDWQSVLPPVTEPVRLERFEVDEGGRPAQEALEGLATVEQNFHMILGKLEETSDTLRGKRDVLAAIPSIPPTFGHVSSGYGKRRSPMNGRIVHHNGVDIAAPRGSPVVAAAAGIVVYAGWKGAYGKLVEIDHGNGIRTRYAHNGKLFVKEGDKIARGQTIATVGLTGRTTGAHVHYEIHVNGRSVNPRRYLKIAKTHGLGSPVEQPWPDFSSGKQPLAIGGPEIPAIARVDAGEITFPKKASRLAGSLAERSVAASLWLEEVSPIERLYERAGAPFLIGMLFLVWFTRKGGLWLLCRAAWSLARYCYESPFRILDRAIARRQPAEAPAEPVQYWSAESASEPTLESVA